MGITYTGAAAPTRDPVGRRCGRGCRTKRESQKRSLRRGEQESLLEGWGTQFAARRRRIAWRSLRATTQRLERVAVEPVESEPCNGLAAVHMCEQLGVDIHVAPHLCEEDCDE
jgi:hypothetical protein